MANLVHTPQAEQAVMPPLELNDIEATRRHARELGRALMAERKAREKVEKDLRKLNRVVDHSPAMAMLLDTDGRIETVNLRVSAVTGFRIDELVGQPLDILATEASRRELYPRLWGAVRKGREWQGEIEHRRKDGRPLWVSLSLSPVTEPDGAASGYVAILLDISEARRAEQMLRKANRQLQKVSDLKSSFVSTVSHELRTPLTAIRNSLDILATAPEGEDRQRFLGVAVRNVDRLTHLVNDLLDLNRVEAGRMSFNFSEVEPARLIEEVASTFQAQASAGQVLLGCQLPSGLPSLWADPARISQVLGNLVSNALKFTGPGGRVILEAHSGIDEVELAVRDTGIGMTPDQVRKIFDPFYQVEEASSALRERELRGSGLGLAIARDLVAAHGGKLRAESAPGEGSRFVLTLPVAGPAAKEMTDLEAEFQKYREHPFFGVLSIPLPAEWDGDDPEVRGERLAALARELRGHLPRPSDRIVAQPAHRRLVLTFLGTDKAGCQVVSDRLARGVAARPASLEGLGAVIPRLRGPAVYPDDGTSARDLLDAAENPIPSDLNEGECHE